MSTTTQIEPVGTEQADIAPAGPADEVVEEVLVEEISIDGMCGVY